MLHQLIVCRGQGSIYLTILGLVNGSLGVLNTHTHGKCLGLHGDAAGVEHFKGVSGAVANGQYCGITGDDLPFPGLDSGEPIVLNHQLCHLGIEAHLTAQMLDPPPQILHHRQ